MGRQVKSRQNGQREISAPSQPSRSVYGNRVTGARRAAKATAVIASTAFSSLSFCYSTSKTISDSQSHGSSGCGIDNGTSGVNDWQNLTAGSGAAKRTSQNNKVRRSASLPSTRKSNNGVVSNSTNLVPGRISENGELESSMSLFGPKKINNAATQRKFGDRIQNNKVGGSFTLPRPRTSKKSDMSSSPKSVVKCISQIENSSTPLLREDSMNSAVTDLHFGVRPKSTKRSVSSYFTRKAKHADADPSSMNHNTNKPSLSRFKPLAKTNDVDALLSLTFSEQKQALEFAESIERALQRYPKGRVEHADHDFYEDLVKQEIAAQQRRKDLKPKLKSGDAIVPAPQREGTAQQSRQSAPKNRTTRLSIFGRKNGAADQSTVPLLGQRTVRRPSVSARRLLCCFAAAEGDEIEKEPTDRSMNFYPKSGVEAAEHNFYASYDF